MIIFLPIILSSSFSGLPRTVNPAEPPLSLALCPLPARLHLGGRQRDGAGLRIEPMPGEQFGLPFQLSHGGAIGRYVPHLNGAIKGCRHHFPPIGTPITSRHRGGG